MNTTTAPIARAYLPQTTRRFSAIMNVERKMPGQALYVRGEFTESPEGATGTAWDLYTTEAVEAYRRAGAIVATR